MDIQQNYLTWLRDAHAMEEQALTMMRGMIGRLDDYPSLRARVDETANKFLRQG